MASRIRTQDVITAETMGVEFSQMGISDRVKKGLANAGYVHPTPIQLRSIPLGLMGADLIVQGKAGTGKTLIFTVLTLESIDATSALPQALILTATREIALQICSVIEKVGFEIPKLQCHTFIGGTNRSKDKVNLKSCQVVVGSTGRIKDLCDNGTLYTGKIKMFFIDEVDALLGNPNTMGDINSIFRNLPERKQVCTFSATYTPALLEILGTYMRTPRTVTIDDNKVSLRGVTEYYIIKPTKEDQKNEVTSIIKNIPFTQCMVFSNDIEFAQELVVTLCQEGITADLMSSKLEQQERTAVIKKFAAFDIRVLVSSDVTARGIDMTRVNVVISTDIPKGGETYMHRIGRTGRYGSLGVAISVIPKSELEVLRSFRKHLGSDNELTPLPTDLSTIDTSYMKGVLATDTDKQKFETHKQAQSEQAPTKVPRNARRRLTKKAESEEKVEDSDDTDEEDTTDSNTSEPQIKRQHVEPPTSAPVQMMYQQAQVPVASQPQVPVQQQSFCPPQFVQPASVTTAHQQLCDYYNNYYRAYYEVAAKCLSQTFGVNGASTIPPPPPPRF
eukprot:TRINITY_DN3392_c0_g3_i1.p1 TRINITY_DN3392_c0_g3~~TRINITY_DN3392_c0_g3_i1.p1  ORF type:complete len:594 (+),score=140.70 TRINITY_DN3392_c0_g3_i1:103-1782(+)